MIKKTHLLTSVGLWTLCTTGCDQLTATTQAVSVLTASPELALSEGYDASLAMLFDLESVGVGNVVGVAVGVGERDSPTSTEPPAAIGDAIVDVAWGGATVSLCGGQTGVPAGTYVSSNTAAPGFGDCVDGGLAYAAGATYETTIDTGSSEHTIRVTAPDPIPATDVAFTPNLTASPIAGLTLLGHARNTSLNVDWAGASDAGDRPAFVTVGRVSFSGDANNSISVLDSANWSVDAANPIFSSTPTSPGEMISLVLDTPPTSAQVPSTVFNGAGVYFLVLTSTEMSTDVSNNLAIGSGGLAGKGTAFVFFVE